MAALNDLIRSAGGHHLHLLAGTEGPLHKPHIDNDAAIAVILAVEDQGF